MLLENFTATLNKLMCYNENYQKHIHTFLVYFITIFPQKSRSIIKYTASTATPSTLQVLDLLSSLTHRHIDSLTC